MAQIDISGAYMVPSKVYVGDYANLILPLPGFPGGKDAIVMPGPLPSLPDISIHSIAIERRPGGSFLSIEFSAYTTGILELPPIGIAGETFSGLSIEISSILSADESGAVLSAPALPLAIPGTSLLIYGNIGAAVLLVLAISWGLFWGRGRLQSWLEAWRRRRLLYAMQRVERRLYRALLKKAECRKILDLLVCEFRNFLANFTGMPYRAMTAAEIKLFHDNPAHKDDCYRPFLSRFFRYCDGMRFSGHEINDDETLAVLGNLKQFLAELKI